MGFGARMGLWAKVAFGWVRRMRLARDIYRHIYKVAAASCCGALFWLAGCAEPYDTALLRAGQMVREGKCEQAVAVYEKTLPRIPADAKRERALALVGYGDCLTAGGKLREAFASYQGAWQSDNENLDAHLRLAQFLANGDQPQLAAEHARFVLRRRADDAVALGILGGVEEAAGHAEEARPLLERALASFAAADPQRPMVAISLAQVYLQENRIDAARKVLTEATQAAGDQRQSAMPWMALGRLEEQQGNRDAAEQAYRAAVRADDEVITNFRFAQFLERSAKIAEAEQVLQHVDALRPAEPSALAEARLEAGRTSEALAVMHVTSARAAARVIEGGLDSSRSADSLQQYRQLLDGTSVAVMEAELALERGDVRQAEANAKRALERSPDSAAAHYVRGRVFEQQDKIAEAKEQWNSALESEADYVPAEIVLAEQNLKEGDLKTAEQHISSVVRDEPLNLQALCTFARVLLREGKRQAAIAIAKRAQAVNPAAQEAHFVLGEIALARRDYGTAFLEYERVLLMEPDSPEALNGVLEVYRHGRVTRAVLEKMERVASSPPASASLLEIAGRLYAAKGMYREAERALRHSLEADPKRETAAVALAQANFEGGERRPENFVNELAVIAGSDHEVARTLRTLQAAEAEERGNVDGAIRAYEMAVGAGETSGVAANNLAWDYAQRGIKLDEALQLASSAVDRDPKNPAALDTMGVVQLKRRRYSEAVASLDKAIALMSGEEWRRQSAEVYRHLAEACDGAGITDRAEQARARAAKIEKEYSR